MRGLLLKIFVIVWIAQSLIFVLSTDFIFRHHFERPDVIHDELKRRLQIDGAKTASAFELCGCQPVRAYGVGIGETAALEGSNGQDLCTAPGVEGLGMGLPSPTRATGSQIGMQSVWRVAVVSTAGKRYVLVLSRLHAPPADPRYHDWLRFLFLQLPVAIVVGGFTTFVLVLLFSRPVVQLRKAARELASGKLGARVTWPNVKPGVFAQDEIHGLIEDFNHIAERSESLVDAQKLLLRNVSHELRSPLARQSVALELAREDSDSATEPQLDSIQREAERLNLLIGQLLTLLSMETLESLENPEALSLNSLIERILPDAEYEARQCQCTIVFHAMDECVVNDNRELLHRAIENVVRNAIRYTENGTEVEILLRESGGPGLSKAEIEVSDHGPGVPENQREAILRPFYWVDYARSPNTGGLEVGLAIADRVMRLHGGDLRASNRPGGEATCRISIPAIAAGR